MTKLSKRFAKIKADQLCKDIRDLGAGYVKRYSEIRTKGPTLRIKLFGTDHHFKQLLEKSYILKYMRAAGIDYHFIDNQRWPPRPKSFAFWLPLKNL